MASVDLNSALDLYAERGDWDRALETAAEHGNDVLHKYVALCATQRIRDGRASDALQVIIVAFFVQYVWVRRKSCKKCKKE